MPPPTPPPQLTSHFFPLSSVSLPLQQEAPWYGDISQGLSIPTTPRSKPSAAQELLQSISYWTPLRRHEEAVCIKQSWLYKLILFDIDIVSSQFDLSSIHTRKCANLLPLLLRRVTWIWTCDVCVNRFQVRIFVVIVVIFTHTHKNRHKQLCSVQLKP